MSETVTRREPADNAPVAQREITEPTAIAPALGLIGLGAPGQAAALALIRAGHRLLACDPDPDRCRAYAVAAGPDADVTDTAAEVAERCTVVLLLLDLGADAITVHDALQDRLPPGALIVDLSPALPGDLRRMAAALATHGLHLVDAVLLHTDPAIVLAGGAEADQVLAAPILQVFGTIVVTGPVGSAQALAALIAELDEVPDLARIRALATC